MNARQLLQLRDIEIVMGVGNPFFQPRSSEDGLSRYRPATMNGPPYRILII